MHNDYGCKVHKDFIKCIYNNIINSCVTALINVLFKGKAHKSNCPDMPSDVMLQCTFVFFAFVYFCIVCAMRHDITGHVWAVGFVSLPISKTGKNKDNTKVIPGWSDHVQEHHDRSLFWHDMMWVQCGRQHNGVVAKCYETYTC